MAPTTRRGPNTPVNNTNPNNMTPESIQAMIDQALLRNSTNGDGSHSSHGDNRRKCKTDAALVFLRADYREGVKSRNKIELWNLKVKGNDVPAYTECFQELTLICTKFVANETEKVDKYISGLPDNIYGNVKSARPKTLDETIELANDLMDQKLCTYAKRQSDNKRKADGSSRDNHGHQPQPFKRQNVSKLYNMGTGEKKPYGGSLPNMHKSHLNAQRPVQWKSDNARSGIDYYAYSCDELACDMPYLPLLYMANSLQIHFVFKLLTPATNATPGVMKFYAWLKNSFKNFYELDYDVLVKLEECWWRVNTNEVFPFTRRDDRLRGPYANAKPKWTFKPYLNVNRQPEWNNETNNEDNFQKGQKCMEDLTHEPSACKIRRFEMTKYTFEADEEYMAIKELEHINHLETNMNTSYAYRELFRKMDDGWLVTRANNEREEKKEKVELNDQLEQNNYGVTCEDEAKRRNSGAKTKTFEENCYLLLYVVSSKEDTAYPRQLITRICVMINSLYGVSLFINTPYAQLVISQRYEVNVIDGN
ncbi:hypothetical protein Tco_1262612 [Tanacetum coccineum]